MICPHCGKQTANTSLCDHCGCSTEFAVRTNYQSLGTSSNEISCPPVQNSEPNQIPPAQNNRIRPKTPTKKVSATEFPHQQAPRQSYPPVQNRQAGYYPYPEQRDHSRKKSKVEQLVPWLIGAVAVLLIASIVATIAFSWLLKKVDKLNDQISSAKHSAVEDDIREVPTPTAISETLPEETEAVTSTDEGIGEENTTGQESEDITVQESADAEANNDATSEAAEILIIFDVNPLPKMEFYGSSPDAPEAISVDQEMPFLSDVTDSFHGYTWAFTGWNTKPDGTGLPVRLGQIFDLPLSESITLFAQWEEHDEFRPPVD